MSANSTARATREWGPTHLGWCVLVALASACAFWLPARAACHGDWPAPLDDVFIHFDFARAAATGRPFSWIAGQGYSSGETSPLYALVLALGYAIGFRGYFMAVWAAMVALASVVVAMRAVADLVAPAPTWVAWSCAPLLVCVGTLDWSLWSGMEVALLFAVVSQALLAAKRTQSAPPTSRRAAQWTLGAWGALLVWTRPEMAVVVGTLAFLAARASRTQSPWAALARASLPGALATLSILLLNQVMTGNPQSAGARLKLLSSNPYLSDVDRGREFVMNLFTFAFKVLRDQLALWPTLAWLFVAVPGIALISAKTRPLVAAILLSCGLYALLVSWNGAARYQNFRYYAPALELLLIATCLGIGALARSRARVVALPLAAFLIAGAASRVGSQIDHFVVASTNIHDQQVEVGHRIATRTPADAIVLVGDAGAIAYFSGRHAIDALGLGGYHAAPFIDAAPDGEAATAEILQRLEPNMRPTHLALYPNWFPALTSHFGREIDRVTIEHNVICGGPTKVLYEANFSTLDGDGPPGGNLLDEIDVADVISESAHDYVSPAPFGGWTLLDVRARSDGRRVFDAGRTLPDGQRESFVTKARGAVVVVMRTDNSDASASVTSGGASATLTATTRSREGWIELRARLSVSERVEIAPQKGALRDYHLWILAD